MAADEYVDVRVTHYHCSKEVPFLSWERKRGLLRPGRLTPSNPLRYVKAFHLTADWFTLFSIRSHCQELTIIPYLPIRLDSCVWKCGEFGSHNKYYLHHLLTNSKISYTFMLFVWLFQAFPGYFLLVNTYSLLVNTGKSLVIVERRMLVISVPYIPIPVITIAYIRIAASYVLDIVMDVWEILINRFPGIGLL